jgi:hypothetical protein
MRTALACAAAGSLAAVVHAQAPAIPSPNGKTHVLVDTRFASGALADLETPTAVE